MRRDDVFIVHKKFITLIAAGCFLVGSGFSAHAQSPSFSVEPASKQANQVGYYQYRVGPGRMYKASFLLENGSTKSTTVTVQKLNALTSSNGGRIAYEPETKQPYSKLIDMNRAASQYIFGPANIKLQGKERKVVTYTFKTPKNIKNGLIVGALGFSSPLDRTTSKLKTKVKNGELTELLINQPQRVIGIEGIYKRQPKENVLINQPAVRTTPSGPLVLPMLKNVSPIIVKHVSFNYKVLNAHGTLIFKGQSTDMEMAPSSEVYYSIPWRAETFAPGQYRLLMQGTIDGKKFSKAFNFVVPDQTVRNYQSETGERPVAAPGIHWWVWFIGAFVLGGLIVFLIFFIFIKRRKKEEEEKDSAESSLKN
ncbi:MAG: DUF3324 domain-containing protein [Sporolactobacillus sp.]